MYINVDTDQLLGYQDEVKGYLDRKSRTWLKRMAIYHPYATVLAVDEVFSHALLTQGHHKLLYGWGK